jgi:ABC-type phosphate/phosphonate transport system substrate-binding protein
MHMVRSPLGSIVSLVFLLFVTHTAVHAQINFGVNALRGANEALTTWGELGKYLSAELGQPVHIVPLKVMDLVAEVVLKDIRFALVNPVQMVHMQEIFQATPLVSLNSPLGPRFAGVIIAKKGSGITHAEALKGKKVVGMSKTAAAGYMLQAYHLLKRGIDVHKDFASFQQAQKQDDLVMLVQKGVADAAFVRSGLLEDMEKEGKLKVADFEVVDQKSGDNFAPVHTTVLYPEWYVAATAKTDVALAQRVKAALLRLTSTTEVARIARINGFVEPLALDEWKSVVAALRIGLSDR